MKVQLGLRSLRRGGHRAGESHSIILIVDGIIKGSVDSYGGIDNPSYMNKKIHKKNHLWGVIGLPSLFIVGDVESNLFKNRHMESQEDIDMLKERGLKFISIINIIDDL